MREILIFEDLSAGAVEFLRSAGTLRFAEAPDLGMALAGEKTHAIVTRGKGRIDAALLDACPNLRVVARAGVGLDNVAVDRATQLGIPVINAPGSNAATVAEHTFGLMLSLQRRLYAAVSENKSGNWAYRNAYAGDELRGKTLGILGRGNIGTRVAAIAEAFGMRVLYLARTRVQYEDLKSNERNLYELMAEADILSLHLPLTDRTHHLLGEKAFSKIKPGSLIVNTARGEVVDHAALLGALESGRIGGYAADVMSNEQRRKHPQVITHERALITPHIASLTTRTFNDICEVTARNVLAILNGDAIPDRYIANRNH